jgi:hypothetical protein
LFKCVCFGEHDIGIGTVLTESLGIDSFVVVNVPHRLPSFS